MSREPPFVPLTPYGVRAVAAACIMIVLCLQTPAGQTDESFTYRGETFLMSPFSALFDGSTLGQARTRLFVEYLKSSPEGLARVKQAGSSDPAIVWARLDAEEKTTFLAVTAAASRLQSEQSGTILSWFERLDQIHGSVKPGGGVYRNNEAFRLYIHLAKPGIAYVKDGGDFANICTKKPVKDGGFGSKHPDFCNPSKKFQRQRPTRNNPRLQINVTDASGCADVDLDYDFDNSEHLTKDNSNVLGSHVDEDPRILPPHTKIFVDEGTATSVSGGHNHDWCGHHACGRPAEWVRDSRRLRTESPRDARQSNVR